MTDDTQDEHTNHLPKPKDPAAVALGRRGGLAGTGKAKARSREKMQAAVRVRWDRRAKQSPSPS